MYWALPGLLMFALEKIYQDQYSAIAAELARGVFKYTDMHWMLNLKKIIFKAI